MMANRVLPTVRLIFPCDDAARGLQDDKWLLKHPWFAVFLPTGTTFPFRLLGAWVYAMLTDGVGNYSLSVELLHVRDDGTRRTVGSSAAIQVTFPGNQRFLALDEVFHLKSVPFREAGLYEFRVIAETNAGEFQPLPGQTAQLRGLDPRATP